MQRRGPRGDIDSARILLAADSQLTKRGTIDDISLRGIAAEVGVAVNALYTYFPSLRAIWHDLADERLGLLRPKELLEFNCSHCAILELVERAAAMAAVPGTLSLLRAQPVLGKNSFALSEAIMTLTEHASIDARNAHDLIVGWFYGGSVLDAEGWTSGTDEIREAESLPEFPRISGRAVSDRHQQAEAILRGIGLSCTASQ